MNEMNKKKVYVCKLADFLQRHGMRMSSEELAAHLNRNDYMTGYGTEYAGGRGTYRLIQASWKWLSTDLGLEDEGKKVADAFVKPDGSYAYEV